MKKIIAKRVSNYELFYDLVFVLAISSLTGLLHGEHIGTKEILGFITANIIVLTLWSNETIYLNKYGERDFMDIFTIIPSMYLIGNLSLNFSNDYQLTALPFNVCLALSYLLIFLQYYLRGRRIGMNEDIKATLHMLTYYIATFSIASVMVAMGIWVYNEWILLVYFLPILISYFFQSKLSHEPINFPHMVERCQLITIITFGETVVAVIKNYPLTSQAVEGILLFFAMATLFIFYISQTYLTIDHHRKADVTVLLYAHLVIVLGLNFFTVAIELFSSHPNGLALGMLISGLTLFYVGILGTSRYNRDLYRIGWKGLLVYGSSLLVGIVLLFLTSGNFLILLVVLNLLTHTMLLINTRRYRLAQQRLEGEAE